MKEEPFFLRELEVEEETIFYENSSLDVHMIIEQCLKDAVLSGLAYHSNYR